MEGKEIIDNIIIGRVEPYIYAFTTNTVPNYLKIGDTLNGTVRNVTPFGAFVDIGLHDDGLIHISKMSKDFVKDPGDILSVGEIIEVYVDSIDLAKKRIGLSLIK